MGTIKEGYILSLIDPESVILGDINLEGYNLNKPIAQADIAHEILDKLPAEAFENNPGGDTKEVGMEPLTLITEEREYEPGYGNPEGIVRLVIVKIPETDEYKVRWIENGQFSEKKSYYTDDYDDAIATADAMASEAKRVGYKVEVEYPSITVSNPGEPIGSNFHSLMLHAVAEMYGPGGIVVDEAKAKATSCECVEYKPGKLWCTSKGVVGALTDEQERIYCNPRIMVEKTGVKERMAKWAESVEICRAQLPPTDGRTRLEIYLDCMSKQLTKAGVEA